MTENRKYLLLTLLIANVVLLFWGLSNSFIEQSTPQTNTCKEDSLQSMVYQLQGELKSEEDGWDSKERRYEDILFEYEYGINHLKNSHPDAYREFHRIIGYKERFERETERENNKRLKINNF